MKQNIMGANGRDRLCDNRHHLWSQYVDGVDSDGTVSSVQGVAEACL